MSKNVLLVGWDPAVVDFSLLPQLDLNEEKLRRALAIDRERLTTIGYRAQWCFLKRDEGDENLLIEALKSDNPQLRQVASLSLAVIRFQGDEGTPVLDLLRKAAESAPQQR